MHVAVQPSIKHLLMAFINFKKKEVQLKVVYYGPGRGGKTTNLEYVFSKFKDQTLTDLVTIKTQGDRTLFFDFLPFDMGKIEGYDVKVQLYTVPGQAMYNSTRQLVLRGVDGVVFVADSLAAMRKKNLISLKNLQDNLKIHKKSIFKIPLVLQYNKIDLAERGIPLTPVETLERDLNKQLKVPSFPASAIMGTNVLETLKKIITLTMTTVEDQMK